MPRASLMINYFVNTVMQNVSILKHSNSMVMLCLDDCWASYFKNETHDTLLVTVL